MKRLKAHARNRRGRGIRGLPEDVAGKVNKFQSVGALAEGYVHLQNLTAGEKVYLPKEDASEEEFNQFYKALGRPDEAKGYSVDSAKFGLEEGAEETGMLQWFRAAAHKAGLTQKQFEDLTYGFNDYAVGEHEQLIENNEQEYENTEMALRAKWGAKYDRNMEMSRLGMLQYVGGDTAEERMEFFEAFGRRYGNDPMIMQVLHDYAKVTVEPSMSSPDGAQAQMTEHDVQGKINDLMNSAAYNNKSDPNHNAAVRQVEQLFRQKRKLAAA